MPVRRSKSTTQKKKTTGGFAWLPLLMGTSAGISLVRNIVKTIKGKGSKRQGYQMKGPVKKKGFY